MQLTRTLSMTANLQWQPDDESFWREQGHQLTAHFPKLNLMLLLAGACVWMQWSVLAVLMLNAGFPFSIEQLFRLIASAGLAAACIRMMGGFLLHHSGMRAAMLLSVYLLLVPLGLLWFALSDINTEFWKFQALAICSGLGGSLLMQVLNASYYTFPKKQQPLVQEVPLALANSGLVLVLVAIPLFVQLPEFAWFNGHPLLLKLASSNISGSVEVGQPIWLNAVVWLPLWLLIGALFWLHRLPAIYTHTADTRVKFSGAVRTFCVVVLALLGCAMLLMPSVMVDTLGQLPAVREISMIVALGLVLLWMRLFVAKHIDVIARQIEILNNREVHLLALLYLMGMGSLLGLAVSYPLLIKSVFSIKLDAQGALTSNPVGPSVLIYGWLPVILGLVARAFGNWLAHRFKAALINQWSLVFMLASAVAMAYYLHQAHNSDHPEQWFLTFFLSSLVFFWAAGLSAGSVMAIIIRAIPHQQMEQALTWIIALTTAGTFYMPQMFADHWQAAGPAAIIQGFALFYVLGLIVNWLAYVRAKAA